jgi:hypothetical protein
MSDEQITEFFADYDKKSAIMVEILRRDYSMDDVGVICDLRKVPFLTIGDFVIEDSIIATPAEPDKFIKPVLGMNVLEKFHFGFDVADKWLYLSKRETPESYAHPDFRCGNVKYIGKTDPQPPTQAAAPDKSDRAHIASISAQTTPTNDDPTSEP